jgi:hypothetical protein
MLKRYEFSATVSIQANSAEEARRLINREVTEAKAPVSRRARGDVRPIKLEVAPKPISKT